MNTPPARTDANVSFPFRPVFLLMFAMGALSLAGAGAAVANAEPAVASTSR